MPKLDGLSATRNIRQYDTWTPIISMTANTTDRDVQEYILSGMTDVLPKPLDQRTLRKLLERYCAHLKAVRQGFYERGQQQQHQQQQHPFLGGIVGSTSGGGFSEAVASTATAAGLLEHPMPPPPPPPPYPSMAPPVVISAAASSAAAFMDPAVQEQHRWQVFVNSNSHPILSNDTLTSALIEDGNAQKRAKLDV